jgi:hypothetical protein
MFKGINLPLSPAMIDVGTYILESCPEYCVTGFCSAHAPLNTKVLIAWLKVNSIKRLGESQL